MANKEDLKFTEAPRQRKPNDRKWDNPDVPKKDKDKKEKAKTNQEE